MPIPSSSPTYNPKTLVWSLLTLGAVLLLGMLAWGLHSTYEDRMQRSRHQAERELMAIGHLQAYSVAAWREQRMADAFTLMDDTLFASATADWLKAGSSERAMRVQQRLRILLERAKYDAVFLVDSHGRLQLAAEGPTRQKLPEAEQHALQEALSQATVVAVEPRVDPFFAFPFFSVVAPLFDGDQAIGAVWLVSDVRNSLFQLLDQWPNRSDTAESSIVTRQGDELVYLSPLRHITDSGINVRNSLTRSNDPAVQAILGARGIFYGQDYRDKDVIAMASAVPDTPWLVITKIDEAEVIDSTRRRELLALGLPVVLGVLLIGILFTLWQRSAWLRERALKTELQRNMRWLEGAQKAASIGYFSLDVAQARFVMSRMADVIFGTTKNSLEQMAQWVELIHPDERQRIRDLHIQSMKQQKPLRAQYRILRADDGQLRWVEVWCEIELNEKKDRVSHMIGTVQDITERKQAEEDLNCYRDALEEKIRLDALTQIANRRALDEHMATEWQRAMRRSTPLAFLMIDVDYFKLYNDHYGHVAGDECLKRVAQTIAASVNRAGELAARYGGEEFAVLLPEADLDRALQTAERICEAVRSLEIEHSSSTVAPCVTVSIGVVCEQPVFIESSVSSQPDTAQSVQSEPIQQSVQRMINRADDALYQAKQQGRNRSVLYITD